MCYMHRLSAVVHNRGYVYILEVRNRQSGLHERYGKWCEKVRFYFVHLQSPKWLVRILKKWEKYTCWARIDTSTFVKSKANKSFSRLRHFWECGGRQQISEGYMVSKMLGTTALFICSNSLCTQRNSTIAAGRILRGSVNPVVLWVVSSISVLVTGLFLLWINPPVFIGFSVNYYELGVQWINEPSEYRYISNSTYIIHELIQINSGKQQQFPTADFQIKTTPPN